mgnify:CR=1 FL=1
MPDPDRSGPFLGRVDGVGVVAAFPQNFDVGQDFQGSVATPGTLMAWCEMLSRYGTLSLADADAVIEAVAAAAKACA